MSQSPCIETELEISPMSLFKSLTIGTVILAGAASAALAHDTRRIEHSQARQRAAIEEGRWNGTITKREQRALIAEQEHIDALRRRAKADGNVTAREYRAIRGAQRAARFHILEERRDRQVNLWRRWRARYGL
jgi:hypothetical protein